MSPGRNNTDPDVLKILDALARAQGCSALVEEQEEESLAEITNTISELGKDKEDNIGNGIKRSNVREREDRYRSVLTRACARHLLDVLAASEALETKSLAAHFYTESLPGIQCPFEPFFPSLQTCCWEKTDSAVENTLGALDQLVLLRAVSGKRKKEKSKQQKEKDQKKEESGKYITGLFSGSESHRNYLHAYLRSLASPLPTSHLRVAIEGIRLEVAGSPSPTRGSEEKKGSEPVVGKKVTESDAVLLSELIGCLDEKLHTSHYVVCREILGLVGDLIQVHSPNTVIEHGSWSEKNRARLRLVLTDHPLVPNKEDVELLNDRLLGESALKMLLRAEPGDLAELLIGFEVQKTGSRYLRVLSQKTSPERKKKIFCVLARAESPNAVYFVPGGDPDVPEFLDLIGPIHRTEEIRVQYLEVLVECLKTKEKKDLRTGFLHLARFLSVNQILEGKESLERARNAIRHLAKKVCRVMHRIESIQRRISQDLPVDQTLPKQDVLVPKKEIQMIISPVFQVVIRMCRGTNASRQLQGLHYLHAFFSDPYTRVLLNEPQVLDLVRQRLSSPTKSIREVSASFSVCIKSEEVLRTIRSGTPNEIHGILLLFFGSAPSAESLLSIVQKLRSEVRPKSSSVLSPSNSANSFHLPCSPGMIQFFALAYNSLLSIPSSLGDTGPRILTASSCQLDPEFLVLHNKCVGKRGKIYDVCRSIKKRGETHRKILAHLNQVYRLIIPQIFRDARHALVGSQEEEKNLAMIPQNGRVYEAWPLLREALPYITIYGIAKKDNRVIGTVLDLLLDLGGHLGLATVASNCLKSLLMYHKSGASRKKHLDLVLSRIRVLSENTAVVRRGGGIPFIFRAVAEAEAANRNTPGIRCLIGSMLSRAFGVPERDLENADSVLLHSCIEKNRETPSWEKLSVSFPLLLSALRSVAETSSFKYDLSGFEPSLFFLSLFLLAHDSWRVRNGALMLYAALLKKSFRGRSNTSSGPENLQRMLRVQRRTRDVLGHFLRYFVQEKNSNGIFAVLVFLFRAPDIDPAEATALFLVIRDGDLMHNPRVVEGAKRVLASNGLHKAEEKEKKAEVQFLNAHTQFPGQLKLHMEAVKDNGPEKCPESVLELITAENPSIRSIALKCLGMEYSQEQHVHQTLQNSNCKPCLRRHIVSAMKEQENWQLSQNGENTSGVGGSREHQAEPENAFRDFRYELEILDDEMKEIRASSECKCIPKKEMGVTDT